MSFIRWVHFHKVVREIITYWALGVLPNIKETLKYNFDIFPGVIVLYPYWGCCLFQCRIWYVVYVMNDCATLDIHSSIHRWLIRFMVCHSRLYSGHHIYDIYREGEYSMIIQNIFFDAWIYILRRIIHQLQTTVGTWSSGDHKCNFAIIVQLSLCKGAIEQ